MEYWPHKFTKVGSPKQIGEEQIYNSTKVPVMAQEMICVCCDVRYTHPSQAQPAGPCPARTDKAEMARILNT